MGFKEYLQRVGVFRSFGYDLEKERKFVLEKVMPLKGSLLEVGTGKGHFTIALAQEGYQFISLDISEEEQKFARENILHLGLERNVEFQVGNAEKLAFEDGRFYHVFAINLVHHLSNVFAVISEMARVIDSKGEIVLSDFNENGFALIEKIHSSEGRQHLQGKVGLDDVQLYLGQKGFRVEKFETEVQEMLIATRT